MGSKMLEGKERMLKHTIAKITTFRGYVDKWKVAELLKTRVEEQWKWDARPLMDGRYLIECPLAVTARQMEKEGPMESPAFTQPFTPWTTDLYHSVEAEGTCAGDLVQIGGNGGVDTEDLRVLIPMRKTRLLPCVFHYNIATLQHTYIAEMEPYQSPLSWDSRTRTEQKVAIMSNNDKTEEPPAAVHSSPLKPSDNRADKGKATISVLQDAPAPARFDGGRQKGIIIQERKETQPIKRSELAPPAPECTAARKPIVATSKQAAPVPVETVEVAEEVTGRKDGTRVVTKDDKTEHVAQGQLAASEDRAQSIEDADDMDFAETIRSLTAT
ncbi:hypothetical protein J5N97_008217 [Dioscorea zingiberensis]|uniref:Uncharacterized protein n=1 Tax=Dioscorea zingiberensis TaxID=325984 RepID=A0A9D5DDG4_9LILI|nr:hypothetical protein J5N97_008217 [Dioscorea zingiberensis]